MHLSLLLAAVVSVGLYELLGSNRVPSNLLNMSWILAPYLVLSGEMVFAEKRTSLLATAIATLFGSVGALMPGVVSRMVDVDTAGRVLPIYQAGVIAVLVPICRWIVARMEVDPPAHL